MKTSVLLCDDCKKCVSNFKCDLCKCDLCYDCCYEFGIRKYGEETTFALRRLTSTYNYEGKTAIMNNPSLIIPICKDCYKKLGLKKEDMEIIKQKMYDIVKEYVIEGEI